MNTISVIASISLLLATGAAVAQDAPAAVTRAQVIAELAQARAAGQLDQSEAAYDHPRQASSGVTREQVRAEVLAARAAGTLDHNDAVDSVAYMNPAPRARTAAVDVRMATKSGKASVTQQ